MSGKVFEDRIYFMSENYIASCHVTANKDCDGYKIDCVDFNGLSERFNPIYVLDRIAATFVYFFQSSFRSMIFYVSPVLFNKPDKGLVKCKIVDKGSTMFLVM